MQSPSGTGSGPSAGTLSNIGTGIAAGGSLFKGIGGYEAGKFNAKVDQYNKRVALDDETGQEQQVRDAARQAEGEQIAGQGASGMQLGVGSAIDVLHQSAVNAQLDALNLRRKASISAQNFDNQAWAAKAQGNAAFLGGITDAATAVFKGGADYAAAGA